MRILLAEDNATNRYLIMAYLQAAGHMVMSVHNGREAVAAAEEGGFDAVLMDVQMPEMDGLAATRAIRALPGPAAAVPIIALTANAMSGDRDAVPGGRHERLPLQADRGVGAAPRADARPRAVAGGDARRRRRTATPLGFRRVAAAAAAGEAMDSGLRWPLSLRAARAPACNARAAPSQPAEPA